MMRLIVHDIGWLFCVPALLLLGYSADAVRRLRRVRHCDELVFDVLDPKEN